MDFARKQLEKYGWTDGKGLGKHENGISQALKPTLKRSMTGIGHDAASDYTDHWWTALFNKAANNIEVEHKNGKVKKFKKKEEGEFEITNSTWRLQRKQKNIGEEQYKDFFIKKAILASGGVKTKKIKESEESEDETEAKDIFKMTDEELFKACEGRTAHKGARHGLKSLGKLARIERQEQMLLAQPKYEAYCNANKSKEIVENANLNSDSENIQIKERAKKKKKKRCLSHEDQICSENINLNSDIEVTGKCKKNVEVANVDSDSENIQIKERVKKKKKKHYLSHKDQMPEEFVNININIGIDVIVESCEIREDIARRSKKTKSKLIDKEDNDTYMSTSKKQKFNNENEDSMSMETDFDSTNNAMNSENGFIKKIKKKKKKNNAF